MFHELRLRTLLATAFGVLALAVAAAGSFAVQQLEGERARRAVGGEMAGLAGQVSNMLDRSMFERWREVQVLASVAQTSAPSNDARRSWLDAMRRTFPAYAWIGFADRDGIVRASTGGLLEGASVAARPWFQAGRTATHVDDVHEAALLASKLPRLASGEPWRFVDVAAPVLDAAGGWQGVLGAHLSWTWANEMTRSVLGPVTARYPGLEAFVVARDGTVLLGPSPLQGTRIPPSILALVPERSGASREAGRALFAVERWTNDASFLVGISRTQGSGDYPGLGWTVALRQPVDSAFGPVRIVSYQILAGGGLLALLFGVIGWWTAGRIARPLDDLTRAATLARTEGITALPPGGGSMEITSLSASLGALLRQLAERDTALAAANAELEERVSTRTKDLEQTGSLLRLAQEAAGAGTWDWDMATDTVCLSPESARLYGLPCDGGPVTVAQAVWATRIDPDDAAAAFAAVRVAVETRETYVVELRAPRADEECDVWILGLGRVYFDADGIAPVRMVGLNLDITQRKRTELALEAAIREAEEARRRAEQASEAKTVFLASMSHEIRTPLSGILGYADLLLDDRSLAAPPRRHAERIRSAGSALLTVVNDVLDFSRVEAGQLSLDPRPFDLATLLEDALSIVRGSAESKGLALTMRSDLRLHARLVGDDARLRQVLLNLLNNAVKFTAHGAIELAVQKSGRSERGFETIRFSVRDTGIGIPDAKRNLLFQRFTQVDASVTRAFGGTGLGLAISKSLVQLMDGTIGFESRHGEGSTFWFTVTLAHVAVQAVETTDPAPVVPSAAKATILLVEDLEINRDLARHVLEAAGHAVDCVTDGAAAVRAVQERAYDLVLMDIQMPGMDGLTATRRIRALDASGDASFARDTPIVAMSANVMPAQIAETVAAGMDGHIGKPFKRADLQAAIRRWRRHPVETAPVSPDGGNPHDAIVDQPTYRAMADLIGRTRMQHLLGELRTLMQDRLQASLGAPDDRTTLAAAAHDLVSACGLLGFTRLSLSCQALHSACREERSLAPFLAEFASASTEALAAIDHLKRAA